MEGGDRPKGVIPKGAANARKALWHNGEMGMKQVEAGIVGGMPDIIESMSKAGKVLSL